MEMLNSPDAYANISLNLEMKSPVIASNQRLGLMIWQQYSDVKKIMSWDVTY